MTRFLSVLLAVACVATAFGLGGCSSYEEIRIDGSRTVVRSVGVVPRAPYAAPDYWDHRYYRGDTRGIACTGPFGQVINGICYHTKPAWMR